LDTPSYDYNDVFGDPHHVMLTPPEFCRSISLSIVAKINI